MPLPWPSFWQHIRLDDRPAITEILTELLAHGALIGESGRDRERFLLAREYERDLAEYLAPLHIELSFDPDRPIVQLRPVPGDCGLTARFNKAETLTLLTLWRLYHDARMATTTPAVTVTANDLWQAMRVYFPSITPPTEAHLREMLGSLRQRRFLRWQTADDAVSFGETQIEILPTLARAIPFEKAEVWAEQVKLYQSGDSDIPDPAEVTP
jgi:Domain of unknown function (DUF4194)